MIQIMEKTLMEIYFTESLCRERKQALPNTLHKSLDLRNNFIFSSQFHFNPFYYDLNSVRLRVIHLAEKTEDDNPHSNKK